MKVSNECTKPNSAPAWWAQWAELLLAASPQISRSKKVEPERTFEEHTRPRLDLIAQRQLVRDKYDLIRHL